MYFNRELVRRGLFIVNNLVVDIHDLHSFEVDGTVIRVFIRAGNTVYERQVPSKGLTQEDMIEKYMDCYEAKNQFNRQSSEYWNGQDLSIAGTNDVIGTNTCNSPDLPHNQVAPEPNDITPEELEELLK